MRNYENQLRVLLSFPVIFFLPDLTFEKLLRGTGVTVKWIVFGRKLMWYFKSVLLQK